MFLAWGPPSFGWGSRMIFILSGLLSHVDSEEAGHNIFLEIVEKMEPLVRWAASHCVSLAVKATSLALIDFQRDCTENSAIFVNGLATLQSLATGISPNGPYNIHPPSFVCKLFAKKVHRSIHAPASHVNDNRNFFCLCLSTLPIWTFSDSCGTFLILPSLLIWQNMCPVSDPLIWQFYQSLSQQMFFQNCFLWAGPSARYHLGGRRKWRNCQFQGFWSWPPRSLSEFTSGLNCLPLLHLPRSQSLLITHCDWALQDLHMVILSSNILEVWLIINLISADRVDWGSEVKM